MLIKLLMVFCLFPCTPIQENETDNAKAALYSIIGAIEMDDWAFLYNHSTPAFRKHIVASLVYSEQLLADPKITDLLKKHIDLSKLREKSLNANETELANPTKLMDLIDSMITRKKQLFETGLAKIPNMKSDLILAMPERIDSIEVSGSLATVNGIFRHNSYSTKKEGKEVKRTRLFDHKIFLRKTEGKWLIESPAGIEQNKDPVEP